MFPTYLGITDAGSGEDWAILGPKRAVFRGAVSVGAGIDIATLNLRPSMPIVDIGEGIDSAAMVAPIVSLAGFALADVGGGEDSAAINLAMALSLIDSGAGFDRAAIGDASLPLVPGGVVNIIRNPSAENDLTDWSADSGSGVARDSVDAWVGEWSVVASFPATTANAAVHVASVSEIGTITGLASVIGSIAAIGNLPGVAVRVTAHYRDASIVSALGDFNDVSALEWSRIASEAATIDPSNPIDYFSLAVVRAGNRILNPSLEVNTTGWSGISGATITRDTVEVFHGIASLRVSPSATDKSGTRYNSGPIVSLAGETITVGMWIKAPIGMDNQLRVVFRNAALAELLVSISVAFPGTGEWQFVSHTDVAPATATNHYIDVWRIGTAPVADFWIDAVQSLPYAELPSFDAGAAATLRVDGAQIEDATTGGATPYVDGDQGDDSHWYGAPHASVSYREAGS